MKHTYWPGAVLEPCAIPSGLVQSGTTCHSFGLVAVILEPCTIPTGLVVCCVCVPNKATAYQILPGCGCISE